MTARMFACSRHLLAKIIFVAFLGLASSGRVTAFLRAQPTGGEADRFEVASIRPDRDDNGQPSAQHTPDGGLRASHMTLKTLIEFAYGIRSEQLSGADSWTDSDRFTVIAKGPEHGSSLAGAEQIALNQKCLQTLLRERFGLGLRRETLVSGYLLVVDKKGLKLVIAHDPAVHQLRQLGRWKIRAVATDMSTLAAFLGAHLQATVVDQSGLEGFTISN